MTWTKPRWLEWLLYRQPRTFYARRPTTVSHAATVCPEHGAHLGACGRCAGTVCPRPACGLPKQPDRETCPDARCKRWARRRRKRTTEAAPAKVLRMEGRR